jgi:hypothetical protein
MGVQGVQGVQGWAVATVPFAFAITMKWIQQNTFLHTLQLFWWVPLHPPRLHNILNGFRKADHFNLFNPLTFVICNLIDFSVSSQIIQGYCKSNKHFQCFIEMKVLLIYPKYLQGFLIHVLKFV